ALPGDTGRRQLPRPRWNQPSLLTRNVDADLGAEAETVRHLCDAVDPDQIGGVVEEDVAGFADGAMHRQRAVAAFLPAMEHGVAEVEFARTKEFRVWRDHAGLERGDCHQR